MAERGRRDIRRKQQEILRRAGELFLKQGYEKTNIRQIAAELSISLGLVSYYFPTKRDLVKQLFSQQLAAETELVRQYILQEEDPILFTGTLTKLQMTAISMR